MHILVWYLSFILDLQPISRELLDNVARPLRLMPTIELIKYSFVPHHQHGRRASQEWIGSKGDLAKYKPEVIIFPKGLAPRVYK